MYSMSHSESKPTVAGGLTRLLSSHLPAFLVLLAGLACQAGEPPPTPEMPVHLEDYLDSAIVTGSETPLELPEPVEWSFDQPQTLWRAVPTVKPGTEQARVIKTEQGIRVTLTNETDHGSWGGRPNLYGGAYVNLPDWEREDWGDILIRARTTDKVDYIEVGFNLRSEAGEKPFEQFPFLYYGGEFPVIRDGTEQTYVVPADRSVDYSLQWKGPWRELGIAFGAHEPVTVEILSVRVVPKEAAYSEAPWGIRTEVRNQKYRRALYTHAPSALAYRVRVPKEGRLDFGVGVLREDAPVTFRVRLNGAEVLDNLLLETTYSDKNDWEQHSLNLEHLAGQVIDLTLETDTERQGAVALWAAPTLSGQRSTERPNVIFYVIDGAGADYMSVYGYNRRTTPELERLAEQGVLFENAYANASWTRPSTLTFLTSLQHSSMGGMVNNRNAPPEQALTISERLHEIGYQTALFTSNPNAATMSQLDRGVDVLREKSVQPTSVSTRELHADFWRWRKEYPGEPYWVHFQTTDVHWPHNPPTPFSGLFVSAERRAQLDDWDRRLAAAGVRQDPWSDVFEKAGVNRKAYFGGKRDLYAEAMAHQDSQLGRLVDRLKDSGEWENTLLIVAADHAASAGAWDYAIAGMEELPPMWRPLFRPGETRIPMIFVWPGQIPGGKRIRSAVSMIDMVPTILDLVGEPTPEITMGQSLKPLLMGRPGWEPRPVILDEFYRDSNSGKLRGQIEVVDGRWGASLEINEDPEGDDRPPEQRRPVPLLLYDLWEDPLCLKSLHEERPGLVRHYTELLTIQFRSHQAVAHIFTSPADSPLSPEQLRTLQSLGYIQ